MLPAPNGKSGAAWWRGPGDSQPVPITQVRRQHGRNAGWLRAQAHRTQPPRLRTSCPGTGLAIEATRSTAFFWISLNKDNEGVAWWHFKPRH